MEYYWRDILLFKPVSRNLKQGISLPSSHAVVKTYFIYSLHFAMPSNAARDEYMNGMHENLN